MRRTGKPRGEAGFVERYRGIFGDRWESLAAALAAPPDSVAFRAEPESEPYFLDSGSIFAASSLDLPESGLVLDACAAPGGKTLVIAARMWAMTASRRAASVADPGAGSEAASPLRLVANELSGRRRARLVEVLDRHLPPGPRALVEVSGRDAASLCRSLPGRFGAILLDVPCSSERHVLADPAALADWGPARVRSLAIRQWALLSSAFEMLAPGGCLVYSTCALSPEENDAVAERLARKRGGGFEFDPPSDPRAEPTARGVMIMPDRSSGAGPMYVCRIRKAGAATV